MAGFNKPGRKPREDGRNPATVANNKYQKTAYDRLSLLVLKGNKEVIKKRAAERGESINGYLNSLIADDIPGYTPPAKSEYIKASQE